jgi:sugar O-acyltransferase (sialic acid O-acetyltransferase NeuD family)
VSGEIWTVFGMGNLIWDICDAIESRGDAVRRMVLNMEADPDQLQKVPGRIEVIELDSFQPEEGDRYCFGFVHPAKEPLLAELAAFSLSFDNVIHSFSYVSPWARLGRGNYVGPGAVLSPYAELGDFNYINRCASVSHDTVLGSYNHMGPGALVAGRCRVGSRNFLGAGSVVIDGITVGDDTILGAGATAVRDLTQPGTYIGTPARRMEK